MDDAGNIRVVCRFRPLNEKERTLDQGICVSFPPDNQSVQVSGSHNFQFDYVFTPDASQAEVYEVAAKPVVGSVMQGFNGTVLAYGQTSSGKTFTMTGASLDDHELMGVIPRMVGTVFDQIEEAGDHYEFAVKVSYCEIYLEKIKDLLDPAKNNLKIHENKAKGIYIEGLTEQYVSNELEVYELMKQGTRNREVGSTNMNAGSSRSHSIFSIQVSQTNTEEFSAKTGKLHLVDLAGSEKVGKTGAEGKRLEEAKKINVSLTSLGQVIYALTDSSVKHVPYRNSKLTRVLQDSLGGNSKTTLVITCSPSPYNEEETVSTLRFGIRAKSVKNKAKVNREYTIPELRQMLARAQEEINKRDLRIHELEQGLPGTPVEAAETVDLESKLEIEVELNQRNQEILDELRRENQELRSHLGELKADRAAKKEELQEYKDRLAAAEATVETLTVAQKDLEAHLEQANAAQSSKQEDAVAASLKRILFSGNASEASGESPVAIPSDVPTEPPSESPIEELKESPSEALSQPPAEESSAPQIEELGEPLSEDSNEQTRNLPRQTARQTLAHVASAVASILKQCEPSENEAQAESWAKQREDLLMELQKRIDHAVNLEIELDNARENIRRLQYALSQDSKTLALRNAFLETNFQDLKIKYQEALCQYQVAEAHSKASDQRVLELSKENKKLETRLTLLEGALKEAEEQAKLLETQAFSMNLPIAFLMNKHMRKTIKGGSRVSRVFSGNRPSREGLSKKFFSNQQPE